MYRIIDGKVVLTVDDWCQAGLSYRQFIHDNERGYLDIHKRGYRGNTLIDVTAIRRPDRLQVIEAKYGKVADALNAAKLAQITGVPMALQPLQIEAEKTDPTRRGMFKFTLDTEAREYYIGFRKPDDTPLDAARIEEYTNRASLLNGCIEALDTYRKARVRAGKRIILGEFYKVAAEWFRDVSENHFPAGKMTSAKTFEKVFKRYLNGGYSSLIHGGIGNDSKLKVSDSLDKLLLALWVTHDKPFIKRVHKLYMEFCAGKKEFYDKETGVTFRPQDFWRDGKPVSISKSTVWNRLKDVVNFSAVYTARNGNFDYLNSHRPKHHRKNGQYSLSKISMDDVALSRKSTRGRVFKYIAVDVVSGYYFKPAYIVGKPNKNTVMESFRNMFSELVSLCFPVPGELEVEHHLMKDIDWLHEVFGIVRFCNGPTEKRAEHNIRSLKYGVAKDAGHTCGRFYAKHEAFRTAKTKVEGDFVEPLHDPGQLIADDLDDIRNHNNELHPRQKTYPGMTRRDVFLQNVHPGLKPIEEWYLFKRIGNVTETSIRNNDYVTVNGNEYELESFEDLKKLKPNNCRVTAYWLQVSNPYYSDEAYLYQDDKYIGKAVRRADTSYNECAIEQTEEDKEAMLHQFKRLAKYDKLIKEARADIPKVAHRPAGVVEKMFEAPVEVVPAPPAPEEKDIFNLNISYGDEEELKRKAREMM
jgi:hypothetical protein